MKNRYFISGDIALIEIYHGPSERFHYTIVDSEDIPFILENVRSVHLFYDWYTHYAKYSPKENSSTSRNLHRLLMNTPNHLVVDHINHNGLDNRKVNLRNCTSKENHKNRRKSGSFKHNPDYGWQKHLAELSWLKRHLKENPI